jgi:hypothetical protein
MTKGKDHPMDESAHPTPRPKADAKLSGRKKQEKRANLDSQSASGKTDPTAFDAKNNNMHKKR